MLASGHLVIDASSGAVPAMIPVFTALYALSDLAASMILGASLLVSSAIQPLFGLLADRRPTPAFLWGGVAVAAAGLAASGLAGGYVGVLACIVGSGLGIAAFHPEAARVANQISAGRPATGLAWFMVGGHAGFALGPLLAALFIPLLDERATLVFLVPGVPSPCGCTTSARLTVAVHGRARRAAPRPREQLGHRPAAVRHQHAHLDRVLPARPRPAAARGRPRLLRPGRRLRRGGVRRRGGDGHGRGRRPRRPRGRQADAGVDHAGRGAADRGLPPDRRAVSIDPAFTAAGFVLLASFSVTVMMGQEYLPDRLALAAGLMIGFGAIGVAPPGLALFGAIADAAGREAAIWGLAVLPLLAGAVALVLPEPRAAPREAPA